MLKDFIHQLTSVEFWKLYWEFIKSARVELTIIALITLVACIDYGKLLYSIAYTLGKARGTIFVDDSKINFKGDKDAFERVVTKEWKRVAVRVQRLEGWKRTAMVAYMDVLFNYISSDYALTMVPIGDRLVPVPYNTNIK